MRQASHRAAALEVMMAEGTLDRDSVRESLEPTLDSSSALALRSVLGIEFTTDANATVGHVTCWPCATGRVRLGRGAGDRGRAHGSENIRKYT